MSRRFRMLVGRIFMRFLPLQSLPGLSRAILRFMGHTVADGVVFYSSGEIIGVVKVSIGENTFVGHKLLIMGGDSNVHIGSNCDISSSVSLITGTHRIGGRQRRAGEGHSRDITIGNGVWIGYGATVLGGVTIGNGVIIAAGSLVNKDIPDNVIAAGVPARSVRSLEDDIS